MKNIINFSEFKTNENYNKPYGEMADLMGKYGVDILADNTVLKDGKKIGKIKQHMIPSGKYFIEDKNKRELELKDSFENALKDLIENN